MVAEFEGAKAAQLVGSKAVQANAGAGNGVIMGAKEVELAEAAKATKGTTTAVKSTGLTAKAGAAGKTAGLSTGKVGAGLGAAKVSTGTVAKLGAAAGAGAAAKGVAAGGTLWTGTGYSLGLGLGLGMWGPMVVAGAGALLIAGAYTYMKSRQNAG